MNKLLMALISGCTILVLAACGSLAAQKQTHQQSSSQETSQAQHVDELVITEAHVEESEQNRIAGTKHVVFTIKNTGKKALLLEGVLYQNVFAGDSFPQAVEDSNGRGAGDVTIFPGESKELFIQVNEGLHADKVKLLGYRLKSKKQLIDGSFSQPIEVELAWD